MFHYIWNANCKQWKTFRIIGYNLFAYSSNTVVWDILKEEKETDLYSSTKQKEEGSTATNEL
jgi:hypothetical protein